MTAFFASLVKCIEALSVVLAVGAVLGWRGSLPGTGAALALLLALPDSVVARCRYGEVFSDGVLEF